MEQMQRITKSGVLSNLMVNGQPNPMKEINLEKGDIITYNLTGGKCEAIVYKTAPMNDLDFFKSRYGVMWNNPAQRAIERKVGSGKYATMDRVIFKVDPNGDTKEIGWLCGVMIDGNKFGINYTIDVNQKARREIRKGKEVLLLYKLGKP